MLYNNKHTFVVKVQDECEYKYGSLGFFEVGRLKSKLKYPLSSAIALIELRRREFAHARFPPGFGLLAITQEE